MPYRAVIFDLFGTLADFSYGQYSKVLGEMAAVRAAPRSEFVRLWTDALPSREADTVSTLEESIHVICDRLAVKVRRSEVETAKNILVSFLPDIRSEAESTLVKLQRSGYRTGLITNCPREVEVLWQQTPIARYVDAPVFSYQVGVRKPDARIYHEACQRLGIGTKECLFIGDGGSRELSGAVAAGMDAICIRWPEEDPDDAKWLGREEWTGVTIRRLRDVFSILNEPPRSTE